MKVAGRGGQGVIRVIEFIWHDMIGFPPDLPAVNYSGMVPREMFFIVFKRMGWEMVRMMTWLLFLFSFAFMLVSLLSIVIISLGALRVLPLIPHANVFLIVAVLLAACQLSRVVDRFIWNGFKNPWNVNE